ncbi:hypothetical protein ACFOZ5_09310 [Marinobacter lacisalsi]|uniref:Solute-binding protein family 3/N-terminal domain-containing protein n=1 Tax=Marinobacter lacisalsi TaxID=475979 RepID=A0ABV8QGT4_9GAMM
MKYLLCLVLALPLCGLPGASADARTLNLYTFHSPPYQDRPPPAEGSLQRPFGTTVETVRCVANIMDWQTRIRIVPQNRALHGLQNHLIDGYFAVDESDLLNRFAQPTAPVALEKWYFYSLAPIEDFSRARIATIAGSNEAIWLEQSRYGTALTVTYPEQLLALLERGRVDAVLMDERVMSLQQHKDNNPDNLHSRFVRFAPLSLYVTLPFAAANPSFLNEFNGHIAECMNGGFELSEKERASATTAARALMNELVAAYHLPAYLKDPEPPAQLSRILELDERWQEQAPYRASEKAAEILSSRLSVKLAQWQYEQGGGVTEILVMDTVGANVAISVLTSDYWQGDERKFTAIAGKGSDALYLGPVRFDPSAQEFQVIASMPVHDPDTGQFIGGVALGLNIEHILRSQYLLPVE